MRLAQSPRELSSPVPHMRCAEFGQLWLNPIMSIDQLNKHFPADQIFKTMIPVNAAFQRAENERKTIIRYDPTTLGAKAYRSLAKELLEVFSLDGHEEP